MTSECKIAIPNASILYCTILPNHFFFWWALLPNHVIYSWKYWTLKEQPQRKEDNKTHENNKMDV